MTIRIAITRLPHGEGLPLPSYATPGAAGMDVVAAEDLDLAPGQRHAVATGFRVAIPAGYEIQVRPRSGLAFKHGISVPNTPGTIDSDYRGELKVLLINHGAEPFAIRRGERIAQLVPAAVTLAAFDEVDELAKTDRGAGGFELDRRRLRRVALSDDELDRYARHIVLPQLGGVGQQRLKAASIAIVGAGGIGAAALPALAGAGVGRLTIIDGDTVDLSNLQRQPLYRTADIGQPKAALAAAFVAERNPHVAVTTVAERITAANAAALLADHDLILDGTDNFATRLLVSDTAIAARHSLALRRRAAVPGTGRACSAAALLPLLRRRRVRRRRLRHLRRAWRARRADRHRRQFRRARSRSAQSPASAPTPRARSTCSTGSRSLGGGSIWWQTRRAGACGSNDATNG